MSDLHIAHNSTAILKQKKIEGNLRLRVIFGGAVRENQMNRLWTMIKRLNVKQMQSKRPLLIHLLPMTMSRHEHLQSLELTYVKGLLLYQNT